MVARVPDVVPASVHNPCVADYQAEARRAAQRYGLDPNIFVRQIRQESNFNPNAVSGAGAIGIAQIMPGTAKGWGVDPHDPIASLNAAAKNMAAYVKKYGSYRDALVAYNAGPGRVGGALPAETQAYIKTILGSSNPTGLGQVRPSSSSAGAPGAQAPGAPQLLSGGQAGDFTGILAALLKPQQSQPQQAPGSTLAPAAFAAAPALPKGFAPAPIIASPTPQAGSNVSAALSLVEALGGSGPTVGSSGAPATAEGTGASPGIADAVAQQRSSGGVRFSPRARLGDPVVSSKQSVGGTHDTAGLAGYPAKDWFAPAGSHVVAPVSGKVIKLSGHDPAQGAVQGAGGPLGWSVYIQGEDGKTYFLTHLGSRNVKVGDTLKQGQIIGTVADYDKFGRQSHIHQGVRG